MSNVYIVLQEHRIKTITDCEENYWIKERCSKMDCAAKDGLIIFLLVLSGILAAIVLGVLVLFCRKKVVFVFIGFVTEIKLITSYNSSSYTRLSYI